MLPLRKRTVVISRYVLYFLLVTVFSLALLGVLVLKMGLPISQQEISSLFFATSQSLLFGGILLCLTFIFGHDKLKLFLITTTLGIILMGRIIMVGLTNILQLIEISDVYNHPYVFFIFFLLSALFYVGSCLLSLKQFTNKEF